MAGNDSVLPPRSCRRKRPYREVASPSRHKFSKPVPNKPKVLQFTLTDLKNILANLRKNQAAGCFYDPPDPADYPDYTEKVANHIDLTMVQKGLENGIYTKNHGKFKEDVETIWTNAMSYFPRTSARYVLAETCAKDFKDMWDRVTLTKNPLKAMEVRVDELEKLIESVLTRLNRMDKRRERPLSLRERQYLATTIPSLTQEQFNGLLHVLPQITAISGKEIEVNLLQITRDEYVKVREYLTQCKKETPAAVTQPKVEKRERTEFEREVRQGAAELMQAKGVLECSSDSSDSSDPD